MEVGAHSRWASHLLRELGHDVLVANAHKLRAINHNPRKGDRADAETLARLASLDPKLLSPIHHRSPQVSPVRTHQMLENTIATPFPNIEDFPIAGILQGVHVEAKIFNHGL
jgi:hypothetical protein